MQETKVTKNKLFEKIRYEDIDLFISFLTDVRPDYPYRWFFDPHWISDRIEDPTYIWGVLREEDRIIGTVICYYDSPKQISVLKLLLVRPEYRGQGLLNTVLFNRLQEQRVIDQIRTHSPNLLFAEVLVNHQISQKMVQRMGMVFCGFYPNKTVIDGIRADTVPCASIFKQEHKNIWIDSRISDKLNYILNINRITNLRTLNTEIKYSGDSTSSEIVKELKNSDGTGNEEYTVQIDDSNFLTFQFNTYLGNIAEARLNLQNPEFSQVLIDYLQKFGANYTEVMIPPELWMQDALIRNNFKFVGFLPCFWAGEDVLVFSIWKNQSVLIPKIKSIYNKMMVM